MAIYCLVPQDLAENLHDPLRRHFLDDSSVRVVVERRRGERRAGADDRAYRPLSLVDDPAHPAPRNRRIGDQRAMLVEVAAPSLPRRARRHAGRLRFVERIEPAGQEAEDQDTDRLVARAQADDPEAFAALYMRYFDRVYGYLRIALRDSHEAEDLTQQVFLQAFNHLDRYEISPGRPFRSWLFRITRNLLINQFAKHRPALVEDPERISQRGGVGVGRNTVESTLAWLSDSEVELFVERLPLAQRQVLTLRHMIGFSIDETATVLGRTPGSVRQLDFRARRFLEMRLTALGRQPVRAHRQSALAVMRQMRVLRTRRFALLR